MLPPSDFVALLGISLVLTAGCLRVVHGRWGSAWWVKCLVLVIFAAMWLPAGPAQLPLVAYVRGVSSDLSVTMVALACLGASRRLWGMPVFGSHERDAVMSSVAMAALFLYPMALGWGNWDAYRSGWGSVGMLGGLVFVVLAGWAKGLRLLPLLVALAVLAWATGLMESANLWDYLLDPWLAIAALFQCAKALVFKVLARLSAGAPRVGASRAVS